MDVSRRQFQWQLPRILRAMSHSHFVAIDLELSGIQSRPSYFARAAEVSKQKQTLQQRYEEIKDAAEKYQVLQIGLTCVDENLEEEYYTLRPYNFFLNPILEEKLDIERIFAYQGAAVEFLLDHGFRMQAPFLEGVPYLSREEEAVARAIEQSKRDKLGIVDIQIKSDDVEALTFVDRVREEITIWKGRKGITPDDYLNISPPGHAIAPYTEQGLNSFQKRLVHQLVRAEHPDLVTISRPGFIQIVAFEKERENAIKKQKTKAFEEKVAKQVGFRWLVEGIAGGELDAIDPKTFAKTGNDVPFFIDLNEARRDFDSSKALLKSKRTILVGHNVLTDLVNFYKCFIGCLPDSVVEFQTKIHEMFPMIIDTKYLASYGVSGANAKSGLEEMDEVLSPMEAPIIKTHPEHQNYAITTRSHEAGFDAFLTAKVLIRLASKLADEQPNPGNAQTLPAETPEEGGVYVNKETPASSFLSAVEDEKSRRQATTHITRADAMIAKVAAPGVKKYHEVPGRRARFNRFDLLGDNSSEDDDGENSDEKEVLLDFEETKDSAKKSMMPPWEQTAFWQTYGNKLQVNGTLEGVCILYDQ